MMKIAIVTTSYANNYGALLQAYALQRALNENLGQDTVTVDYQPPQHDRSWRLFKKPTDYVDVLMNIYTFLHFKRCANMKRRSAANRKFIKDYIKLTDRSYQTLDDLRALVPDYDCFICGSDQVWNANLTWNKQPDPAFFLQFAAGQDRARVVSYAASVAVPMAEAHKETVREYLKAFDFLSVREISDVAGIQEMTETKVHHVLDPVFLLSQEQWSELAAPPKIKEKYILCYFLSYGNSEGVVQKIREMTGYKVVNINVNLYDKFNSDTVVWDAGALDFISLIKNAEFVCTNSFHCTAFSIIFRKNFVVFDKGALSSRMKSLQTVFGIEDRFVKEDWVETASLDKLKVDYSVLEERIQSKIEESVAYLKGALHETGSEIG